MRGPFSLIAVIALVAVTFALSGCDSQSPEGDSLRVMTWALDTGADRATLDDARGGSSDARMATYYSSILSSEPLARAGSVALTIAQNAPDIVTLQDVLTLRSQFPSNWTPEAPLDATQLRLDVLPFLLDSLEALGTPYDIASEATTADWERPARFGTARSDIRVTERVVILARRGREVGATDRLELPARRIQVDGAALDLDTAAALATFDGVTVATFRFDADDEAAGAKATVLASTLPGASLLIPAHVGTDGDASAAGALRTAGFTDAWLQLVGTGGATCCRTPEATPEARRADLIAARGGIRFLTVATVNGRASGATASRYDALVTDVQVR